MKRGNYWQAVTLLIFGSVFCAIFESWLNSPRAPKAAAVPVAGSAPYYVIAPPIVAGTVNTETPLSQWSIVWTVDNAVHCGRILGIVQDDDQSEQQYLSTLRATSPADAAWVQKRLDQDAPYHFQAQALQCVASDDPRLR